MCGLFGHCFREPSSSEYNSKTHEITVSQTCSRCGKKFSKVWSVKLTFEEDLTLSEEMIDIKECRDLRMYIHEFTKGCVLTKREYRDIMIVLGRAADRLEKSGQVIPEN